MELIPFSVEYDSDLNTIYKFRYLPDTVSTEEPYIVEIKIDELNDALILSKSCTCKGNWQYKMVCKHIKDALSVLTKSKISYRENE